MVLFTEMYASELIGTPVVDRLQDVIGYVKDIYINLNDSFPKILALLLKTSSGNEEKVILIQELELIGKKIVVTKTIKSRTVFASKRDNEISVVRDIMDKQIVDVDGAKVIRVNDLKLAMLDQEVRLIAVDVGISGFLRRLGLEKFFVSLFGFFGKKVPEKLIGWDHVEPLKKDDTRGVITIPHSRISELHPSDVAHIISQVHSSEQKTAFFSSLSEKTAAEALHELEPHIGAMIIQTLDTKKALSILDKMPVDEIADLLGDLPAEKTEEYLRLMRVRKATEIRKLLKHPDETAGGLMTSEFISLPFNYTVEQTINYLRQMAPSFETIYYLYVVDENQTLLGVLSLRALIIAPPEQQISEIMIKDAITVNAEMNVKQLAELVSKYNLLAVPVIDDQKKIQGIITVDDVMDFIIPPLARRKRQMLG